MRIGVIGAGHMGSLHAEKVARLSAEARSLSLAGVADVVAERARALGGRLEVPGFADNAALLERCDAVVVAVPTVDHLAVVRLALEAGCDVLVEKPIAATVEEGEALLDAARARRRVLQVGHLEWFNGALRPIREHIRRPRFVEAHRLGPFAHRATDIDVVRDLMIHDLDILQQLLGEEPQRVEAIGVPVVTSQVDIANARLTYPGGCVANLTASRVSPTPMRKLRFFQPDGYFSLDFLEQTAVVLRREQRGEQAPRVTMERLDTGGGDALESQLCAFAEAVRTRKLPAPAAGDGSGALGALRTALRVIEAMPAPDDLA